MPESLWDIPKNTFFTEHLWTTASKIILSIRQSAHLLPKQELKAIKQVIGKPHQRLL